MLVSIVAVRCFLVSASLCRAAFWWCHILARALLVAARLWTCSVSRLDVVPPDVAWLLTSVFCYAHGLWSPGIIDIFVTLAVLRYFGLASYLVLALLSTCACKLYPYAVALFWCPESTYSIAIAPDYALPSKACA